jgi:hypothetical protein
MDILAIAIFGQDTQPPTQSLRVLDRSHRKAGFDRALKKFSRIISWKALFFKALRLVRFLLRDGPQSSDSCTGFIALLLP